MVLLKVDSTKIEIQAIKAKKAAKRLSILSTEEKNQALTLLADQLEAKVEDILKANEIDIKYGRIEGYSEAYLDRLTLTRERVFDFTSGLREVAKLPDPVGDTLSKWTLDNGLLVKKVCVPLGVIGMIYEARPNVTVDATGLALKSGNAILLKGGSSAIFSNKAIFKVIQETLDKTAIHREAVQLIESTDRIATQQLFTMKEHIDVLIPRGGASLIYSVVNEATVPILETGVGNCHLYIDREADVEKALNILVNAKTDRPAVCNAVETAIIHLDWLEHNKQALIKTLKDHNISVHADKKAAAVIPGAELANVEDWATEYLSLDLAIKTVTSVEEAIEHIDKYGTKHSEAIITENCKTAKKFMDLVDAAAIYHNASTRFTDGGALGLGAEIGISTQKLHARGPMGLAELTTTKYIMTGNGHIR
ncbi:glutamate-5-semialdehyde dehydrogenase [Neobacillus rhizophilus]|uniref:Gamma-glutamyl phosphate reductase n=1 Tax=Neobacillus rhizophilus TaxID=2833579 RepID=A0A942U8W5_9BACI|nr:glutamate-5-semialdehyde dehydrogenase [Neobacillus rhizophilus]MBS4214556.1 glutamate-5-semialdehyde dehydrogenase [Neobacillus rhizophilus]